MKKRAVALTLVLAMAGTSLAACGGGKAPMKMQNQQNL